MRGAARLRWVAASVAVVGLCLPEPLLAAAPPGNQLPIIADVQMRQGGLLLGQVVTPENAPLAGTEVVLLSGGKKLSTGKTDAKGYFAFSGLRRGVYQLTAAQGSGAYRVWTPGTAPPSAQRGALIVAGTDTVRGQNGARLFRNVMANPLVLAGVVATAIAVPIAVSNRTPASGN